MSKLTDVFKVNQRMEIWLWAKPEEQFSSRIEDIDSESMSIAMPMVKNFPVVMPVGDNLSGRVFTNNGIFQFNSSLIAKKAHPLPIWIINLPFDVKKVQLRAFVRVSVSLMIKIKIMESEIIGSDSVENTEDSECATYKAMTNDLSGGGIKITFNRGLKEGTRVELSFELERGEVINALGEIVRTEKVGEGNDRYWLAIKFTDILESDRNKIVKFVFKKQVELRKKGIF